jgi:hypothetical protein
MVTFSREDYLTIYFLLLSIDEEFPLSKKEKALMARIERILK